MHGKAGLDGQWKGVKDFAVEGHGSSSAVGGDGGGYRCKRQLEAC